MESRNQGELIGQDKQARIGRVVLPLVLAAVILLAAWEWADKTEPKIEAVPTQIPTKTVYVDALPLGQPLVLSVVEGEIIWGLVECVRYVNATKAYEAC